MKFVGLFQVMFKKVKAASYRCQRFQFGKDHFYDFCIRSAQFLLDPPKLIAQFFLRPVILRGGRLLTVRSWLELLAIMVAFNNLGIPQARITTVNHRSLYLGRFVGKDVQQAKFQIKSTPEGGGPLRPNRHNERSAIDRTAGRR